LNFNSIVADVATNWLVGVAKAAPTEVNLFLVITSSYCIWE